MATDSEEGTPKKQFHLGELQDFGDIPFEITILIGKTLMTISDLLRLDRGAVVELSKSAGESFDLLANGRLIARGDVTVIDDHLAIRVTEVVEPGRRER
ncbi:MAG TPA: flagellar motor switch protein FliN [Acidobacteriota bacterium]|nr:flagellar motor switch protein FliN [Acidobacteriota bacterium]